MLGYIGETRPIRSGRGRTVGSVISHEFAAEARGTGGERGRF